MLLRKRVLKFVSRSNVLVLLIIMLLSIIYLTIAAFSSFSITGKFLTNVINDFAISTISASVLLLIFEIITFIKDRQNLGFLEGKFKRTYITQINNQSKSGKEISDRVKVEKDSNIKFLDDYKYHELTFYECDKTTWLIELNYKYGGVYSGTAEYYLHGKQSAYDFPKPKTDVEINITLNNADLISGIGSYKYKMADDYGTYKIQVIDKTRNRILVYYQNIIPSGLAEGYEIWERLEHV
ncbi:MAG: hypothetical protein GXC78_07435 [Chitinophagaceae bacterium]|nr:hypothetical protein [Chitinophagaceae bacterium]